MAQTWIRPSAMALEMERGGKMKTTHIKISDHALRALMHAGQILRIAVESGDLSAREKYLASWDRASEAVLKEIENGKSIHR